MSIRAFLRYCDKTVGIVAGHSIASFYKKNPTNNFKPKKILFIKLWAIGESILTLPTLKALAEQFPTSSITVLTTAYVADVFKNQPFITHVDVVAANPFSYLQYLLLHAQAFDISIDGEPYLFASAWGARITGKKSVGFATCGREFLYDQTVAYDDNQHVTATYGNIVQKIGMRTVPPQSLIPITYNQNDINIVRAILQRKGISIHTPMIVLCPTVGGSAKGRMWPMNRFISLANILHTRHKAHIVFLGSFEDSALLLSIAKQTRKKSFFISSLTLSQSAYILQLSNLVIANDSGLMHVSAGMGTPTLGLFGPNTPTRFAPLNNRSQYIYHPCPQSPHINVHQGDIPEIRCDCMRNISISETAQVATEMLRRYDKNLWTMGTCFGVFSQKT